MDIKKDLELKAEFDRDHAWGSDISFEKPDPHHEHHAKLVEDVCAAWPNMSWVNRRTFIKKHPHVVYLDVTALEMESRQRALILQYDRIIYKLEHIVEKENSGLPQSPRPDSPLRSPRSPSTPPPRIKAV